MHALGDGFIGRNEKHKQLRVGFDQIGLSQTPHWTVRIDWMNDCPTQWEEDNPISLEIQVVELSDCRLANLLNLRQNGLDLHLDQLAAARVGDSELQRRLVPIRSHDCIAAINNSC